MDKEIGIFQEYQIVLMVHQNLTLLSFRNQILEQEK